MVLFRLKERTQDLFRGPLVHSGIVQNLVQTGQAPGEFQFGQ